MKVTQEKLPASQVSLQIEIPPETSGKVYEDVLRKYAKSARIPGFRKGKVPRQVLLQQVGSLQLKAAALDELVESSVRKAIEQEELQPVGQARITSSEEELIQNFQPGESLAFSIVVDVFPEVSVADYTGLTLQAEEVKPDPERFDQLLEQQRVQSATLVPVEDRPAQVGDVAIVDYEGELLSEDGEAEADSKEDDSEEDEDDEDDDEGLDLSGLEAEDFQLDLEPEKFIPGFVDGIVGMKPEETRDIEVAFPEDYAREDLAGRKVRFTVTLHELKERELPEVDDDFVQSISNYDSLEELRSALEEQYAKEAEQKQEANKEVALMKALRECAKMDLPESLIEREVTSILNQTMAQLQNQGLDPRQLMTEEMMQQMRERARPDAIKELQTTLVLREIGKREAIEVDDREVEEEVERLLESYPGQKKNRERLKDVVYEDLFKASVLEWLKTRNTFDLVPEGSLPEADAAAEAEATAAAAAVEETAATADAVETTASEVKTTTGGTEES